MSAGNRKLKSFANRLLEISKTDGIVDAEKVAVVIDILKKHKSHRLRRTLELYRDVVRNDIRQSTAKVAYAGAISDSSKAELLKTLEANAGRKLTIEVAEDPSLIAGIKVTVGDSVFEHSIRQMLNQLSTSH